MILGKNCFVPENIHTPPPHRWSLEISRGWQDSKAKRFKGKYMMKLNLNFWRLQSTLSCKHHPWGRYGYIFWTHTLSNHYNITSDFSLGFPGRHHDFVLAPFHYWVPNMTTYECMIGTRSLWWLFVRLVKNRSLMVIQLKLGSMVCVYQNLSFPLLP